MTSSVDELSRLERELLHDRFADFERSVLQENIVLCDSKSGVLLAFGGAMVIFCVDAFVASRSVHPDIAHWIARGLFLVSAITFLVSCHFSGMGRWIWPSSGANDTRLAAGEFWSDNPVTRL